MELECRQPVCSGRGPTELLRNEKIQCAFLAVEIAGSEAGGGWECCIDRSLEKGVARIPRDPRWKEIH